MTTINDLPYETLIHIFKYILDSVNQGQLVDTLGNVCRKWQTIIMDCSLWHTYDGSISNKFLGRLCKMGVLKNTVTFKFSGKKNSLSKTQLEIIYQSMPNLKCVNYSNVHHLLHKKKGSLYLDMLQGSCPNLSSLIINDSCPQVYSFIYPKLLHVFLTERGNKITAINFSFVFLKGVSNVYKVIAENCPNLEELISEGLNCHTPNAVFPIQVMQHSCKKIKILRLGFPIKYKRSKCFPDIGFPDLITFTHPSDEDFYFTDVDFKSILFQSPKLKELDLRGVQLISLEALSELPITNLEILSISKARLIYAQGFCDVLHRWSGSLKEFNACRTKGEEINEILLSLLPTNGISKLEKIDVNNTQITEAMVIKIITNCPHLDLIHLESCRSLRRGVKSKYEGKNRIEQLLTKLSLKQME